MLMLTLMLTATLAGESLLLLQPVLAVLPQRDINPAEEAAKRSRKGAKMRSFQVQIITRLARERKRAGLYVGGGGGAGSSTEEDQPILVV